MQSRWRLLCVPGLVAAVKVDSVLATEEVSSKMLEAAAAWRSCASSMLDIWWPAETVWLCFSIEAKLIPSDCSAELCVISAEAGKLSWMDVSSGNKV